MNYCFVITFTLSCIWVDDLFRTAALHWLFTVSENMHLFRHFSQNTCKTNAWSSHEIRSTHENLSLLQPVVALAHCFSFPLSFALRCQPKVSIESTYDSFSNSFSLFFWTCFWAAVSCVPPPLRCLPTTTVSGPWTNLKKTSLQVGCLGSVIHSPLSHSSELIVPLRIPWSRFMELKIRSSSRRLKELVAKFQ